MNDKDIFTVFFLGAVAAGIYFYAKKKKHPSQPAFKSFLTLALPPFGIFLALIIAMVVVEELVKLPRNAILASALAAAIMSCIIIVVRWSLAKIAMPVTGYVPEPPKIRELITKGNGLSRETYMQKYRVSEKALNQAISMKQVQAEFIDGDLYIEDRKRNL